MLPDRRKMALRRRIIKCLPHAVLEEMSGLERPWNSDRANLELVVFKQRDDGETKAAILEYLGKYS